MGKGSLLFSKASSLGMGLCSYKKLFVQNMTPAVIASFETMLGKWKGQEGKEIEVSREFKLLTSEVISRTAFGSSHLEGEKIFALLDKLSIIMIRNIFKTRIPFINKLWKPADLLESEALGKEIQDCVLKIVKKEKTVVNGDSDSFSNDFLGLLVNAYNDSDEKNSISLQELVAECKTFYLGGQDTVTVFLLAIHGDWQEKARREMTMIINETLRLYGPANGILRKVGTEVQLGKLVFPANIDLLPLNIAVHHDPQLWGDDMHLFKPERFAEGIVKATKHNTGAFSPFGLGPILCRYGLRNHGNEDCSLHDSTTVRLHPLPCLCPLTDVRYRAPTTTWNSNNNRIELH
ncbi:cytochrome P450 CYP749A22-like [Hibiscus syriacus]|uniref:cytochrome P450 CYP749A22-like n=1 Tax=Hibiscus syriacus TaxID=106335 RepID=UPI001921E3AC|nr:cytochrome P450 CYP749A22-like [Hibiscus syriacus]